MTALPRAHAYAEGLTRVKHGHMSKDSGRGRTGKYSFGKGPFLLTLRVNLRIVFS